MIESVGEMIRRLRVEKGEPLRVLAAFLQIDQAIMSKIETGQRRPTKQQVEKLAEYFGADKKEMLVAWLSDRIVYEVAGESLAEEALKVAEEKVNYLRATKITISQVKDALKKELSKYPSVAKAWLFGSFARGEQNYKSDIDIMLDVPSEKDFSLFDMFEIQHNLQNMLKRKIDIVMKGAIKPFAWETAKKDLMLIYDRS